MVLVLVVMVLVVVLLVVVVVVVVPVLLALSLSRPVMLHLCGSYTTCSRNGSTCFGSRLCESARPCNHQFGASGIQHIEVQCGKSPTNL